MTAAVSLATMQDVIARAIAREPEAKARIEKAAALIALGAVAPVGMEAYVVASQTDAGVTYTVTIDGCDCIDFRRHQGRECKHMLAVSLTAIALDRQAVLDRRADAAARAAYTATLARYAPLSSHDLWRLSAFKRDHVASRADRAPRRIMIEGWSPR